MNHNDPLNIHKLFEDIIEEKVVAQEQSKLQLKEKERLEVLYRLDKSNIDEIFDSLLDINIEKDKLLEIEQILIGKVFGQRTIIEICEERRFTHIDVICKCICGSIDKIQLSMLLQGKSKQCELCQYISSRKHIPTLGEVSGCRTITHIFEKNLNKNFQIICVCKCGIDKKISYPVFLKTKQCNNCARINSGLSFRAKPKVGDILHDRVVIEVIFDKSTKVKVKCICGKENIIQYKDIRKGVAKSCYECSMKKERFSKYNERYIGQVFGKRTVISIAERFCRQNLPTVLCKCICGKEDNINYYHLLEGKSNSCKNCSLRKYNAHDVQIGQVFGKRTVISQDSEIRGKELYVFSQCQCNNTMWVRYSELINKPNQGCRKCPRIKKVKLVKIFTTKKKL